MSAQSTERPEVPLPKRSALAGLPGLPWWGAIALAAACAALGGAMDVLSSSDSVSGSFNWLYASGCVLAALLVANAGLFTAAVQPALLLFVATPTTAWLLSSSHQVSSKTLVLLAVPLISRFPWMAWTSGIVLLVCLVRWGLWRLAERRERLHPPKAKTQSAKKLPQRRPSSATARRHKGSPDPLPRRTALAYDAARRDVALRDAAAPRRRGELIDPRRTPATTGSGKIRPRIDPRGLDPLRHTPAKGLPPLPNGARYRQDPPTRSGASPSARGAKHTLPPTKVPAPHDPRDARPTPRARRRYDYEDER